MSLAAHGGMVVTDDDTHSRTSTQQDLSSELASRSRELTAALGRLAAFAPPETPSIENASAWAEARTALGAYVATLRAMNLNPDQTELWVKSVIGAAGRETGADVRLWVKQVVSWAVEEYDRHSATA